MRCLFRADASLQIGNGHVMRCLALATALQQRGAQVEFLSATTEGHLHGLIADRGFTVRALPAEHAASASSEAVEEVRRVLGPSRFDWAVVDHYRLDASWEGAIRSHCERVFVIDDLADRRHDCDMLLDQNLGRTADAYRGLVPAAARLLVGPRHALLRPEFAAARDGSLARRAAPRLERVLISLGGVDLTNLTERVLLALAAAGLPDLSQVVVVLGPTAPWHERIQALAAGLPWPTVVHRNAANMADLMAACDLAIGAAGTTAWERCALGLPSVVFVLADNQRPGAHALAQSGCVQLLASPDDIESELPPVLRRCQDPALLRAMSRAAAGVTDGQGVARVAQALQNRSLENACP